jgi:hypothetical protein
VLDRRRLTVALGLLWLLDGALQLQPYMFTPGSNGFFGPVAENTMGPPNPVTDLIAFAVRLMVAHQVAFNALIAVVQLAIGVLLVSGRLPRVALACSFGWGLGVWVVGEALGGMIFPQASMLTGAPGAAVLYSVASLVLWPKRPDTGETVAESGLLGATAARLVVAAAWCGTALLELERANYAPDAISAQLANSAPGEPAFLAHLDTAAAHLVAGRGTVVAGAMLVVQFFVGWALVRPRRTLHRAAILVAAVVTLVYWVVGQDLGSILTGQGTDPNLGPPMAILLGAVWPRAGRGPRPAPEAAPAPLGVRAPVPADIARARHAGAPARTNWQPTDERGGRHVPGAARDDPDRTLAEATLARAPARRPAAPAGPLPGRGDARDLGARRPRRLRRDP